jgi:hypothetical protein
VAGSGRSARPEIVRYVREVVLDLAQGGGGPATEVDIDPSTLTPSYGGSYAPVGWQEFSGDLGALWWYDWPSGTVERQEDTNAPIRRIRVTETPPEAGGPCLTSITAGSQSLWLTAAAGTPNGGVCVR